MRRAFNCNATRTPFGRYGGVLASALADDRLTPKARVIASAWVSVPLRIMGMGRVPAPRKVLAKADLDIARMDVLALNEAFAAPGLATTLVRI